MLKLLRDGKPVMLAADMDHGIENSVFVPFFGVPACTLTSVSRLARLGRARVVPFVTEVLPDYRGYKMTIFEPLADFPSDDDAVDARRMNAFLETQVLRFPGAILLGASALQASAGGDGRGLLSVVVGPTALRNSPSTHASALALLSLNSADTRTCASCAPNASNALRSA